MTRHHTSSPGARRQGLARAFTTLVAILMLSGLFVATDAPTASFAADGSDFNPGNIIDNATFYDSGTMTTAQIQSFLNEQVRKCRSGYTCLKSYEQKTPNMASKSGFCSAYKGSSSESSASIVYKVGKACGINPQVLLVLLEKEQSLVGDSWPGAGQYAFATGFNCPDTAGCDPAYSGFFNQVYGAAYQFKLYRNHPTSFNYVAGQWNTIYWSPDRSCGHSQVFIENQATAGLYDYTPYRPNKAALDNLYGTGNDCSTYGNRNFWRIFTDWFGKFTTAYQALGGSKGPLGAPKSGVITTADGAWQRFENGGLYENSAGKVIPCVGAVYTRYSSIGGITSSIGAPRGAERTLSSGGVVQNFEFGNIYWKSGVGAYVIAQPIQDIWKDTGWENGSLGYPIADPVSVTKNGGGVSQDFEDGSILSSTATGNHIMPNGQMRDGYFNAGGPSTSGWPVNDARCDLVRGGCAQTFQGGYLYWSKGTGAHFIPTAIGKIWSAAGWENSPLGYPTSDATSTGANGVAASQTFEGGTLFISNTFPDGYTYKQGSSGAIGWPTSEGRCDLTQNGCVQPFPHGYLYRSDDTDSHFIPTAVANTWKSTGWESGRLGYPTADAVSTDKNGGGVSQQFEGGSLYVSDTVGAYVMPNGAIRDSYITRGGPTSTLGWPISAGRCNLTRAGCVQSFQNVYLYWTKTTGAHSVDLRIGELWAANGWENGRFGYPTADPKPYKTGVSEAFEHGTIAWTPETGSIVIK